MSAYCPECHWVGEESDYPPCPSCGDGKPNSFTASDEYGLVGQNKLDAVTYSKLLDEFGEVVALETLNDVNEGRVSAVSVEQNLFSVETKAQYAHRLRSE